MNFKGKMREKSGITLITLVVTIIVLLILAGVTIATLTGENGILAKASDASKESEIASVKEQAQLDITNWIAEKMKNGEDTTVNTPEKVQEILDEANQNNENKYYIGYTETGITTPSGYEVLYEELYTTSSSGENVPVFDENALTIGTAINADKYGQKVTNYTVQTSEMSTKVWRLFYQDSNYTYLITDECIGSYKPSDYYSSYTNGSMVSTIGQKLNPMLLEAETFFVETNTDYSIMATAWLTDTTNWSNYANNEDAIFAIGTPTVELYAASFNATASMNGATAITLQVGTYGYESNTTAELQLQTSYNHGIYNNGNYWWLASPGNDNTNLEITVNAAGFFTNTVANLGSRAIRPIVCIPTSIFNSEYLLSLVDE